MKKAMIIFVIVFILTFLIPLISLIPQKSNNSSELVTLFSAQICSTATAEPNYH